MVHRHVPDIRAQVLQVLADHVFGRGGGESLAKAHADDSVEILRAVHTFGGVAVAAAPKTLYVEWDDLGFGAFNSLCVIERELGYKWSL